MKKIMRNKIKILCFLLSVCLLLPLVSACEKDGGSEDTDSGSVAVEPAKTVAIVLSSAASDVATEIGGKLKTLCEGAGYTATVRNDSEADGTETYRICVGAVNTDVSSAHYGELGACGYGIKIDGNTLSLAGTGDLMLEYAYKKLTAKGFSDTASLFEGIASENVVYSELLYAVKDSKMVLSVSGGSGLEGVPEALTALKGALSSIIKKQVSTSDGEGGDIVVLTSERAESKGLVTDIGYNEYGIVSKNGKIYIYSTTASGLTLAAKQFCALMSDMSDYKNSRALFWPAELTFTESADGSAPSLPYLEGAAVYDAAVSGSYTLSLTAEKQVFLDYADKIAALGYTLAEERTKDCTYMNDSNKYTNIYRTYTNDAYMVHMYFMDHENTVKVVGANISEYEALTDCKPTEGSVESTLTMLDIGVQNPNKEFITNGLCLAIRLSDGRFIVIDGGIWYGADTNAPEVTRLYNWLVDNSPNGKVNIAAWIFTHVHVDHVNAAWKFEQMYGSKVNIERYMHNFVEYDHLLSVEGTDLSKSTYDVVYPRMLDMLERYDNAIMHTGQIYKIGNAEIEIVYTHEDFFPQPMKIVNNTSTVMRITVEGNSILVGGDAEEAAQLVCMNNNGYTLGSDFVQMVHHGYNGLLNYYKYAASGAYTVVLYPKNSGFTSSTANKWLRDNSDELYMADQIRSFALPYKK